MTVILEFLHNDCVIQDEEIRKENERLEEERKKEERRRQIQARIDKEAMEAYAYGKVGMDSTNLENMINGEKISEDFDDKPFIFEVESNSTRKGGKSSSAKDQMELATITSNSRNYEGGNKIKKTKN